MTDPCDLPPSHEGDCDSSQLFLRPADALKIDFGVGIDLESLITADLQADYAAAMDRAVGEMLGDASNWKPTGLTGMSAVLGIEPGGG